METTKSKKKILILGRPKSGKLSLVKALTSSLPSGLTHESTPHAGLTHSITLTTRYFSTEAGIWVDEIPEDTETWLNEYLSEDATIVLHSLAAIILTIHPMSSTVTKDLDILKKLSKRGEDVDWDGTCFVVGRQGQDIALPEGSVFGDDHSLEYIDLNASGENDFGEKLGFPRVLEVLYTCDWTSPTAEDSESIDSFQEGEIDFELNAFDDDKQDGSERDVEYMERMMAMLINAREMGQEMSLEERKRLAQRTVETVAKMS